jgi:hypothetical protein
MLNLVLFCFTLVIIIMLVKHQEVEKLNERDSKRLIEDINRVSISPEERKQRAKLASKRREEMLRPKNKL